MQALDAQGSCLGGGLGSHHNWTNSILQHLENKILKIADVLFGIS
jgi:hypothetical protein